jgi:hypothetical protein
MASPTTDKDFEMRARYDIYCDGLKVASAEGPEEMAEREAWHYAWQYQEEGIVKIYKVEGRKKIELVD